MTCSSKMNESMDDLGHHPNSIDESTFHKRQKWESKGKISKEDHNHNWIRSNAMSLLESRSRHWPKLGRRLGSTFCIFYTRVGHCSTCKHRPHVHSSFRHSVFSIKKICLFLLKRDFTDPKTKLFAANSSKKKKLLATIFNTTIIVQTPNSN